MHYRILSRDEISKLNEFDRTETIEHIYYMRQGNLVLEAEHWDVPDWSDAAKHKDQS